MKNQLKNPKKKDWAKTVKANLEELDIKLTLKCIEEMPRKTYKEMIKRKIKEKAFKYLKNKVETRNGKGKENHYEKLSMQNYLKTDNIDIKNDERKIIFQLRTRMHYSIKTHFRNMHENTICGGCNIEESTSKHTLECQSLLGRNEIVTYIPIFEDLFSEDEEDQVYISRIITDNLKRITT